MTTNEELLRLCGKLEDYAEYAQSKSENESELSHDITAVCTALRDRLKQEQKYLNNIEDTMREIIGLVQPSAPHGAKPQG